MTKDTSQQAVSRFMLALSDSPTIVGENRSNHIVGVGLTKATAFRKPSSFVSAMMWYVGKLNILTGLASLGVATAILAIFGRSAGRRNSVTSLGLISLALGAFPILLFRRSKAEGPGNDDYS